VTVKINDSLTGVTRVGGQKTREAKGKHAAASVANGAADSIEITQTSTQLNILEDKLSRLDTSEPGKLEAVKQAIAEGSFKVDEEVVADALVRDSMENLQRQGKK